MAEWEEVSGDPEYQALPQSEKDRVKLGFFKAEIEPHIDQAKAASLRHDFFAETSAQDSSGLKASLPERAVDALYGTGVAPQATKGLYEASTSFVPDKLKDLLAPGGRSAMESIRPPDGLLEKAAGWAGSGVGSLPNFIGAQGLAKGVLSKVAPRVAASAKMVPRMLKEGLAGSMYTPAELTAQTGGESLKPENLGATAKATAIGAGAFAAFPLAAAVGEKLIGTAIRAAQESGAFAFMRKKFPALFKEAGTSVPQGPPPKEIIPSFLKPKFREGRLVLGARSQSDVNVAQRMLEQGRAEAESFTKASPLEVPIKQPVPADPIELMKAAEEAKRFNVPPSTIMDPEEAAVAKAIAEKMRLAKDLGAGYGDALTQSDRDALARLGAPIPGRRMKINEISSDVPEDVAERLGNLERGVQEAQFDQYLQARQPGLLQRPIPKAATAMPEPIPGAAVPRSPSPMPAPAVVPGQVPEPGLGPVPAGTEARIASSVEKVEGLSPRAQMLMAEKESITRTGTLHGHPEGGWPNTPEGQAAKAQALALRRKFSGLPSDVTESDVKSLPFSHDIATENLKEFTVAAQGLDEAMGNLEKLKAQNTLSPSKDLDTLIAIEEGGVKDKQAIVNLAAERMAAIRKSGGIGIQAYDTAVSVSANEAAAAAERLARRGIVVQGVADMQVRLPLTETWVKTLKKIATLKPLKEGESGRAFDAAVNDMTANLISVFSAVRDTYTNLWDLTTRVSGAAGHDVAHALKTGRMTAPYLSSILNAIGDRFASKGGIGRLAPGMDEALESTVFGMPHAKGPKFWNHDTPAGKFYDFIRSVHLDAKSAVDGQFGRLSAYASLYKDGLLEAEARGLKGQAKREFIDKWLISDASEEAVASAIESGRHAKFNYELGPKAKSYAQNPWIKLLVSPFPGWDIRFAKWALDVMSVDKSRLLRLASGKIPAEEIGYHLGRAAGGIGGLLLLDKFYDTVDFRSMQIVKNSGNRINLSGITPVPEMFLMLALLRGDQDNFLKGIPYASLPGAKLTGGQSGLLGNVIATANRAVKSGKFNPNSMSDEMSDTFNRFIPGQAVLSFAKQLTDKTVRRGIGANIPIVSRFKEPVLNPTTGKPMQVEYVDPIFGMKIPVSQVGSATPMAERVYSPIERAYSKYGGMVYRGPKSAIVGIPESDLPPEYKQEYVKYLGEARQQMVAPVVGFLDLLPKDVAEKKLKELDAQASKQAVAQVKANHMMELVQKMMQNVGKPKESARERGMPGMWR